jgi:outer membrane protein assembly factor BamE (lipoprotein component of BamABCDE complex)
VIWPFRVQRITAVLLATIGLGLSSCAFVRGNYGDAFNADDVETIKVGLSTRQDVASKLGAPERIIEVNDREIFHYYNYALKSGTLLFFSRTNVKGNDLFVFFGRDGVVQEVVFGRQKAAPKLQFWPFGD